MTRTPALAASLIAGLALAACHRATTSASSAADVAAREERAAYERARADSARRPWTAADARFMTDMIHHHSQAIVMARLVPTRDASPQVRTLAERIINAQLDEIATMQRWLADRRLPVPTPDTAAAGGAMGGMAHDMAGMRHDSTMRHDSAMHAMHHDTAGAMAGMQHDASHAMMPGMLTAAQMSELAAARGKAFDRLFLTDMIQHHRGATQMVQRLFGSQGAAQDETVFKFASDVNVDQATEIARMQRMLLELEFTQ